MKKIRVAQIGIGHDHATAAIGSLRKLTDLFEVVGYVAPEIEVQKYGGRRSAFGDIPEMTLEEVLADDTIEAVVIETEEVSLTDVSLACAKAGKHIQMDKPGGLNPDDFEEMLRIMKAKDLVFHTGYMYRYNHEVMRVMDMVKNGDFGEIFSVETHMDCRHPPEKRQWLETFPGGMMFFLGCHLVDLIYGILGVPEEIIPMNCSTGINGVTAEDYGFAVFKYKNGISFAKTCAEEIGGFARRQLVVTGEKCSVELKPLEMYAPGSSDLYTGVTDYTDPAWATLGDSRKGEPHDRYDDMMTAFAQMVRGERTNPWSYEYELQRYRIVLAACGVDIDYKKEIIL
ncbi:MAG: Gfo/Idh/MocA family oxidoreductase [Clostridia bacterium]|nr:Gfo/Idh/MocA family oxidoreductase [Clostridia bacterium]